MLLDEEKLISTSIETYFLWYYCYRKVLSDNMYMAGAGAEIWDKSGAGNKSFRLRHTGMKCSFARVCPVPEFREVKCEELQPGHQVTRLQVLQGQFYQLFTT